MSSCFANTGTSGQLNLQVNETGYSATGNYSWVAVYAQIYTPAGSFHNSANLSVSLSGDVSWSTGSWSFDSSGGWHVLYNGTVTKGHAANGTGSFSATFSLNSSTGTSGVGGPASVGCSTGLSNIAPQPPVNVHTSGITNSSITVNFNGPGSGSSPSNYLVQQATDSGFTQNVTQVNNTTGTSVWSGLNPNQTYYYRVLSQNTSGNSAWVSTSGTTLIAVPNAPTNLQFSSVLPGGFKVTWTDPTNNGGQAPTSADIAYSLTNSLSGATIVNASPYPGGSTGYTLSGLSPGNTYYVWVRANNSAGSGAWSVVASQTTLPSQAPTLTYTADPSGKSGTAAIATPSGVTGASAYLLKVIDQVTFTEVDYSSPTTPIAVTSLLPGRTYSYSAAFIVGSYTSPYSTAQMFTQPAPSTNPGNFFDGNTAATADQVYSFTGTVNESTSLAKGKGVLGWQTQLTSGSAVLARVTGGYSGTYSALLTALTDLANSSRSFTIMSGSSSSMQAAVQGASPYTASLYVNPSKTMLLTVLVSWYDDTGTFISTNLGTPLKVSGTADWTLISVTATAPSNAAYAAVGVTDYDDSSGNWVQTLCGDSVGVDAAMVILNGLFPYFDGSTPDTAYTLNAWLGVPNASASSQTPLTPTTVNPLMNPSLPVIPAAPQPPQITDEGIISVGTWRRYFAAVSASQISQYLSQVATLTLTTGEQSENQVRIRYYENPGNLPPTQVDTSNWIAEQIINYMPANTVMVLDGVEQRAWASVNGGPTVAADSVLYGTGSTPATWPTLSCGMAYLATLDVPTSALASNLTVGVALTRRM